jgi:hypothetical protein
MATAMKGKVNGHDDSPATDAHFRERDDLRANENVVRLMGHRAMFYHRASVYAREDF